ncbi:hypothetical protein KW801_00065 [Candidatus Saccharibacteria bacterium]|nr:hypothetical protein [Candidatus Saccharibacteria bacterium]
MKLESLDYNHPTISANIVPSRERGIFISHSMIGRLAVLHEISPEDAEKIENGNMRALRNYIFQQDSGLYYIKTAAELILSDSHRHGISRSQLQEYAPSPPLRTRRSA